MPLRPNLLVTVDRNTLYFSSWAVVAESVPKSYRVRAAKLVPRLETSFSIRDGGIVTKSGDRSSAANRLIGEVVQSRRRPLLGPSPG